MNHKPGSVTKTLGFGVGDSFGNSRIEPLWGLFSDCHLSWAGLATGLQAAYPRHWTGRPAAAWLCSWRGLPTVLLYLRYCCQYRGGLLPHPFTLTLFWRSQNKAVCFLLRCLSRPFCR